VTYSQGGVKVPTGGILVILGSPRALFVVVKRSAELVQGQCRRYSPDERG